MGDEFERFLAAIEERQRSLESSFREFKGELKAETAKMEIAAKEVTTSFHLLDKSLEGVKAERLPQKYEKLEERVDKLEKWQSWMMGGLAILGTVVSVLTAILIKKL